MSVQVIHSTPLPPGTTERIPADTPRWTLEGAPITTGGPKKDGRIGPAVLRFTSVDTLGGDLDGDYWRSDTKPNVYVSSASIQAVAPTVAPFAGSFPPGFDQAIATPGDANPEIALSVNEYAALVQESAIVVDFVAEGARWMSDNIGSPDYQQQLYVRLNTLANAAQDDNLDGEPALKDGGIVNGEPLLPAITAVQAEINRVELAGSNTGLGQKRVLDPTEFLPALVHSEGDYVDGCPEVKAALTGAGVAKQPAATWAWKAEYAKIWGPVVYQPGAYAS